MISKTEVGARISSLRRKAALSQAAFSELLNVSPQAVSKWETGLSLPDIETLLNMSWIFKVSINSILEGGDGIEEAMGSDREIIFLDRILSCPDCRGRLRKKNNGGSGFSYQCGNGHEYRFVDGVLDFQTREIPGEQWSLTFRNYDEYLHEHHWAGNPNYNRGLDAAEIIWEEMEKRRPRVILDMACGTGQGIKQQIKRIRWPATVIMADISHRILKWNRLYYSTEWKNPFVDMIYLACDGSRLPVLPESVDMVFSNAGYESMQAKMMGGFREAYRVIKGGGCTVYTKSAIEGQENPNSRKWMELLLSSVEQEEAKWWGEQFVDAAQWTEKCRKTGFSENTFTKIYGELPAPDQGIFPFENEMAQWMAGYVFVSEKPGSAPARCTSP